MDDLKNKKTPDEIAERLDVSRWTVIRLFNAGEIHGVRVGGRIRIDPRSVEEYLRKGTR